MPLPEGYHPELDSSDLLQGDDITKYWMLVGSASWAVTLGRFDVHFAVNTMARYTHLPREVHTKTMLRIFGYLKHHVKARIIFDTSIPSFDMSTLQRHNWTDLYPHATYGSELVAARQATDMVQELRYTL